METILIAGGTGLIGNRMVEMLNSDFKIHILSRRQIPNSGNVSYFLWDPDKLIMDEKALECDHIINLTGAGIADKRWSDERKGELLDSRTKAIETLQKGLIKSGKRMKSINCASAIGYYGDRGTEKLTETSPQGSGFLSDCCVEWEKSAQGLSVFTDRLNLLRIGIVLTMKGGALPKMLMTKGIGVLSYFGSGNQFYSWIHIDDLCKMFRFCIENSGANATFNAVSPEPITNKNLTSKISETLKGNQLVVPAPAFALRIAMGEMADVVLNSNRVYPFNMDQMGFQFQYGEIKKAIYNLLYE